MPISLTILLVLAGVVLLAFGIASTGGALRFLSGGAALLVAIVATAATIYLFWIGQKAHWTSDGPGALFVMIAVVVCGIASAVSWMFVFGIAGAVLAPVDALPAAPSRFKRVLRLLGATLLGIAAVGEGITVYTGRGRAAHSAPVVAVSFDINRPSLMTLDAMGTLVDWDLRSKREDRRRTIPELAGATAFFIGADHGFAIANGKAVRFEPFGNTAVETIPDARHIARGDTVVVARDRALLFVSYSDWTKPPYKELAWPEPIVAIAARDMFVVVADRATITLLDGRLNAVKTIASVPAPGVVTRLEVLYEGIVLALDGSGAGWAIDARRGVTEPLAAKASLVTGSKHVFLVSGRDVSEYDPRKKTATPVAKIGSGHRSLDTWGDHVAFGFESGEVVLGTRTGGRLETTRLIARPAGQ